MGKINFLFFKIALLAISCFSNINAQSKKVELKGIVIDESNTPIPYVSISIAIKSIGTTSNDDGEFLFSITPNELQDSLTVSSLGYESLKIKVQDYITNKQDKIILKESLVELDDVVLLSTKSYALEAIKKIRENTLSKSHLIEMLFRRASTEGGKAKFFVENYVKIKDNGPAYQLGTVQVTEVRKSADYRIWKRTQWRHAIKGMAEVNPLREMDSQHYVNLRKFTWKRTGSSSYEGEDVIILEGYHPKRKWRKITLYIGIDSFKIYKIERGSSIYIYKNHKSGKLVLNYYKNEWRFPKDKIPKNYHSTPAVNTTYRLEAFVYNIETDKKKYKVSAYGVDKDMGDLDLKYNPLFWNNLSVPPDTKFFKKIKSELKSIYGVSLEKQFQLANKK